MQRIVWITGAKGFIGRHLARHLAQNGHSVYGIGHGIWPTKESRVWGVSGWLNSGIDIANLEVLRRQSGTPSCVFHLAGGSSVGASFASPHEDFLRTVASTAQLVEWMRISAPEAKLVAVSSAAVYGASYDVPISENFITLPFSPYGHHKLMMEQLCRNYADAFNLQYTIVRLFSVYGSWLQKQLLWDLCCKLDENDEVLCLGGTGQELRDWIEISDVVRLLAFASDPEKNSTLILNGGTGTATSVAEIASMVLNSWGGTTRIEFSGNGRLGDPRRLVADNHTLNAAGFCIKIGVAQGIDDYVKWFKECRR
jgi:UDP-glucose 4-epimerase